MPQLSLPDALRYFFSPFAIYFYYLLYDPAAAKELAKDIGVLGSIAALVTGTAIYYLYRYLIYDDFILSLYDAIRHETQRSL